MIDTRWLVGIRDLCRSRSSVLAATTGTLFAIEGWKECVKNGSFTDEDGWGCLATEDQMSDDTVSPSQAEDREFPDWATHVLWHNM